MLPDAAPGQIVLRFWHAGTRQDFSGAQFWRLVAHHLSAIEATAHEGGITLVLGHTAPDQIALFVALIAAGRLAALFPPNTPLQDEAAYFSQQRASFAKIDPARICIFAPHLAETIQRIDPGFGARTRLVREAASAMAAAADANADADADADANAGAHAAREKFRARLASPDPIFVQHSSGTTGIKKAVAITGQALAAQFQAYWPGMREACGADRLAIASWLPLYHDMGLITSLLLPVIGGDAVSIVDPFEWIAKPGLLFDMIAQDGCNVAWLPNFAFRHLVRLGPGMAPRDLSAMRLWVDCSEPCRLADAAGFERFFAAWGVRPGTVLGCYAMAETVFAATQCKPGESRALAVPHAVQPGADLRQSGARVVTRDSEADGVEKLVLSSGRAVPGMEVAVLAEGGAAPEWVYGELVLRGSFVFGGYRGQSKAESGLSEDGSFRTGDLGTIIDGHVYVFGRLKEIVIVNGKNLFAGDIEDSLGAIDGIRKGRAVAFGMDSPQTGSEELIVIAELDPGAGLAAADIRKAISRLVTDLFLVTPRDVRVVEDRWLVKSTSGKMSRAENRAKYIEAFRTKAAKP
jgi:fatty-acyl-CoA synthase